MSWARSQPTGRLPPATRTTGANKGGSAKASGFSRTPSPSYNPGNLRGPKAATGAAARGGVSRGATSSHTALANKPIPRSGNLKQYWEQDLSTTLIPMRDRLAPIARKAELDQNDLMHAVCAKKKKTDAAEAERDNAEEEYLAFISEQAAFWNDLTEVIANLEEENEANGPQTRQLHAASVATEDEILDLRKDKEVAKERADHANKRSKQMIADMDGFGKEMKKQEDVLKEERKRATAMADSLQEDRAHLTDLRHMCHCIRNNVQVFYVGNSCLSSSSASSGCVAPSSSPMKISGTTPPAASHAGTTANGTPRDPARAGSGKVVSPDALVQLSYMNRGCESSKDNWVKPDEHWYKDELYLEHYTTAELVDCGPWDAHYQYIKQLEEESATEDVEDEDEDMDASSGGADEDPRSPEPKLTDEEHQERLALGRIAEFVLQTELPYIRARMEHCHGSAVVLFFKNNHNFPAASSSSSAGVGDVFASGGNNNTNNSSQDKRDVEPANRGFLFDTVAKNFEKCFRNNATREKDYIVRQQPFTTGAGQPVLTNSKQKAALRQQMRQEADQYVFEGYRASKVSANHICLLGSRKRSAPAATGEDVAEAAMNPSEQSSCSLIQVDSEEDQKAICEILQSSLATKKSTSSANAMASWGNNSSRASVDGPLSGDGAGSPSGQVLRFLRQFFSAPGKAVYVAIIAENPTVPVLSQALRLRALDSRGGPALTEHDRRGDACKGTTEHERKNVVNT